MQCPRQLPRQWKASYAKFDTVCSEMAVTEFDVKTPSFTPDGLAAQANQVGALIKCFVERSYRSGRGKIVNFTKDGLNDRWTFNVNSSIWDSTNQCKPSFYAAVAVGVNYNALDSLIACADTLQASGFTSGSWATLVAALAAARDAMTKDYTATLSAADALGAAKDALKGGIDGLVPVATAVSADETSPTTFTLYQNYPNPFNPSTVVGFQIPAFDHVRLIVYDLLGREVAVLVDEPKAAGRHEVRFNAAGLASGVYTYRLSAGDLHRAARWWW